MTIQSQLEFLSVACNRVSHAVSWSRSESGLVALAASHFIGIYEPGSPDNRGMLTSLRGHSGRVNCVEFIHKLRQEDGEFILSGSADKTCILWRITSTNEWELLSKMQGHTEAVVSISVLSGHSFGSSFSLFASSASDGTVRIWKHSLEEGNHATECIQIIKSASHYSMSLQLSTLPGTQIPILLTGGTDIKLHLFIWDGQEFKLKISAKGHSDWIRAISVATYAPSLDSSNSSLTKGVYGLKPGDLMIASGSQDKYIRIWKITPDNESDFSSNGPTSIFDDLRDMLNLEHGEVKLSTKAHVFDIPVSGAKKRFSLMLDSVLMGHDDWIHSVNWQPEQIITASNGEQSVVQPLRLISASADKSIFVWQPDEDTQNWVNRSRLGEMGGSTLGFYGAHLSPSGKMILANGYNGAIHVWKQSDQGEHVDWEPVIGISGHYAPVKEVTWDPTGSYIISSSLDQTTRLFAPWNRSNLSTWHEIARPQVHGYDMSCLTSLSKYWFVSGADEKLLRVFEAPRTFAQSLQTLTGIKESDEIINQRPIGANVPALGLSNKAVLDVDVKGADSSQGQNFSAYAAVGTGTASLTTTLDHPPFEEHLLQHTLWPEQNKLYGHGYELMSVASNHAGTLVASTSKASKAEHAAIRLWNTSDWKQVGAPLLFHSLTVTSIQFSPNDKFLLTVGRDRSWAIFDMTNVSNDGSWSIVANQQKAHSRIIWDASWSPDGKFFMTGSRDKSLKLWSVEKNFACVLTISSDEAVTSVSFAPQSSDQGYLLAAGFENGDIHLFELKKNGEEWRAQLVHAISELNRHALTVTGLSWKPQDTTAPATFSLLLATSSEDHSVRLFSITL